MWLIPYQHLHIIILREPITEVILMFPQPFRQIGGYSSIQSAISTARKNVNTRLFHDVLLGTPVQAEVQTQGHYAANHWIPVCTGMTSKPFEQFFKINAAPYLLQPVVIQSKPFDYLLPEAFGDPRRELSASMGFYPISNRNNNIKVIIQRLVILTISGSYPEFPDS
jgi:hypothetical protein